EPAACALSRHIQSSPGPVVIIPHEPEFLNMTCERILEVRDTVVFDYTGNYDDYERLKLEAYARQLKEWEPQQKELAKTREFIQQFQGNKSKAGVVESRKKMIDKLDM